MPNLKMNDVTNGYIGIVRCLTTELGALTIHVALIAELILKDITSGNVARSAEKGSLREKARVNADD